MKRDSEDSPGCSSRDTHLTQSDEFLYDADHEDYALVPEKEDLHNVLEQKLALILLKLENCFHVPSAAVDQLLTELHYLLGSALVPISHNILVDFFNNHNLQLDQLHIKELGCALGSANPLSKCLGKDGLLATSFKRKQYYKHNFNIVDPVQYILDAKAKRSFQYVLLLMILHHLLNQTNVFIKVVERRRQQRIVSDHLKYRFFFKMVSITRIMLFSQGRN